MQAVTRQEIVDKCLELEKKGDFDKHVDPVDYSLSVPVTEKFPYIKKGWQKFKIFFQHTFIVKPFTWYHNKFVTRTKVIGRENLKGIKSAIVTCNHVYMFDCLVAKHALKGHKLRITGAEFNNRSDFLGEMMRAGGLMPFSKNFGAMKNLNNAIDYYLLHNNYVLFYPEQAMWYMYEKPRPHKDGAYHYAIKFNVPIIPIFITFKNSGKIDKKTNLEIKYFTVHILRPLYPQRGINNATNLEYMKKTCYDLYVKTYEEAYGKKMEYVTNKKGDKGGEL